MDANQNYSPEQVLSLKGTIYRLVLTLIGAGTLAAGAFLMMAYQGVIKFGQPIGLPLSLSCFLTALILSASALALFNKWTTGLFFPKYKDGNIQIHQELSRTQSALLGIFCWGLPIGIAWGAQAFVEESGGHQLASVLSQLITWTLAGILFGLMSRAFQPGQSKPQQSN